MSRFLPWLVFPTRRHVWAVGTLVAAVDSISARHALFLFYLEGRERWKCIQATILKEKEFQSPFTLKCVSAMWAFSSSTESESKSSHLWHV